MLSRLLILLLASGCPAGRAEQHAQISLSRVFGSCSDDYAAVTDLNKAVGECGLIQVLVNKFNAENGRGFVIVTQSTQAGGYYDRLSAAFAARRPPDIALMHRLLIPDFMQRDLLEPLGADLQQAGVDWGDFVPAALQGLTRDGETYALPFDLHALVWHINLDLFAQAGLLLPDGSPVLPTSESALLAQAERLKASTGRRYLAIPSVLDPMPSWTFETWVWQQGAEVLTADLQAANLRSAQAQKALSLLNALYHKGYADRGQDYAAAEQAFLKGDAAVLINGTWVVDSFLREAGRADAVLKRYGAYTVPLLFETPAAWSDSHLWVRPKTGSSNPRKKDGAVLFLKYLYDQSAAWARTGHLPVRQSVLNSPEFLALPERSHYLSTAKIARSFPPVQSQRAIGFALTQELNASWLAPRPVEESLLKAQEQLNEILKRNRRAAARVQRSGDREYDE